MSEKEKEIAVIGAVAKAMRAVGEALVTVADVLLGECGPLTRSEATSAPAEKKSEEPQARRGRKPKSTTPPAPEVEEEEETDVIDTSELKNEPEADDDFAGLDEEAEEEKEIDEAMLRSKLVEYAKAKGGKEAAFAVLAKFKAKAVKDLKPEQYAKVYAALDAGL
jgi:hypothetical protein